MPRLNWLCSSNFINYTYIPDFVKDTIPTYIMYNFTRRHAVGYTMSRRLRIFPLKMYIYHQKLIPECKKERSALYTAYRYYI